MNQPASQSEFQETSPVVGIVGGSGWLGRAMAANMLSRGVIGAGDLIISSRQGKTPAFPGHEAVRVTADNAALVRAADIIVLSVRPEQFADLRLDCRDRLVISVMACVSFATLATATGAARIVRAMPNAACEIARSYTPWCALGAVTAPDGAFVQALFESCGAADCVSSEAEIDYLAGLSGSGPAFPALLAKAMLDHALARGLPETVARRAVMGAVSDAARLLPDHGPPDRLIGTFMDYRGTTAAALDAMIAGGLPAAVAAGLDAAEAMSRSMTQASGRRTDT